MHRDIFQVIADPTRRAIITLIPLKAMTPKAIADKLQYNKTGSFKKFTDFGNMRTCKTRTERPGHLLFTLNCQNKGN